MSAIAREVGVTELLVAGGVALIAYGFWLVWRPGAYLAAGALILWIALPQRDTFIARPPAAASKKGSD